MLAAAFIFFGVDGCSTTTFGRRRLLVRAWCHSLALALCSERTRLRSRAVREREIWLGGSLQECINLCLSVWRVTR